MHRLKRLQRTLLGTLILAISLGSSAVFAGTAHAGWTTCRTDPIVTLSNGHTVTLYADINADISQVSRVSYELHIPNNVSVTGVWYDSYGSMENLTVVADRNAHHYSAYTTVSTLLSTPVSVSATMSVSGQNSLSVTGTSGQSIYISM